MLPLPKHFIFFLMLFCAGDKNLFAQEHWYVLQIVGPANDTELKSVINTIGQLAPGATVWYNDTRSHTIGCKSFNEISWPQITAELRASDFYLADVTHCRCHALDVNALSSIYFIEACYYANHPETMPPGWTAELNKSEFDALPTAVKSFYQEGENFELVDK